MCCCVILLLIPLQRQHSVSIYAPIYSICPFTPLIITVDRFVVNSIGQISFGVWESHTIVFMFVFIFTAPAWVSYLRTLHLSDSPSILHRALNPCRSPLCALRQHSVTLHLQPLRFLPLSAELSRTSSSVFLCVRCDPTTVRTTKFPRIGAYTRQL